MKIENLLTGELIHCVNKMMDTRISENHDYNSMIFLSELEYNLLKGQCKDETLSFNKDISDMSVEEMLETNVLCVTTDSNFDYTDYMNMVLQLSPIHGFFIIREI